MSLILEALKKSEAERRLGETPNLGSLPIWAPKRKRSLFWWALIPLFAVVSAALWSNRDLISRKSITNNKESSSTVVNTKNPAKASASVAEEKKTDAGNVETLSPSVATNTSRPAVTENPALINNNNLRDQRAKPMPQNIENVDALKGLSAADSERNKSSEPSVPDPQLLAQRKATEGLQTVTRSALPPPLDGPPAVTTRGENRFIPATTPSTAKSSIATVNANREAPMTQMQQSNNPTGTIAVPSPGVSGAAPQSATLPAMANQNNVRSPSSNEAEAVTFYDLTLGQRQGLPELKMSMHVYHHDPARRFVIIDGKRLNRGGAVGAELFVRDIVPNGVIFEYRGIRFLLPRVGS